MSFSQSLKLLLLLGINLSAVYLFPAQPSFAQNLSVPQPSAAPLQLSLLKPSGNSAVAVSCDRLSVITANTICQKELTVPSLWWAKEQFGNKLLDNWLAYPANGSTGARVDLIVNQQGWSLLDYIQQYEFVNKFGNVAQDYGYNVRIFNYQKELLATYTCNFNATPQQCNLQLNTRSLASKR